eukprot:scaffold5298_cov67-Phaeocystis_antarctica.AAC.4
MPSRIMVMLATRMGTIRTVEALPATVPSETSPMRSTGHVSSQPMKRIQGSVRPLASSRLRNGASGIAAAHPDLLDPPAVEKDQELKGREGEAEPSFSEPRGVDHSMTQWCPLVRANLSAARRLGS